jgi:hypothetical protein
VDDAVRKLDSKLQDMLSQGDEGRRKRGLPVEEEEVMAGDNKRLKTEHDPSDATTSTPKKHRPVDPAILGNFDFSTLPNDVLAEIVIESLKMISEGQLDTAIEVHISLHLAPLTDV